MSLLQDIQRGATDHSVPLADLLRKCLVLAQRLQDEPLAKWAEQELNGYASAEDLPPYRKRSAEVRGDFRNPAWQLTNALIPSSAVEEQHRDLLFTQAYLEGVAHYEAMLNTGAHTFGSAWPASLNAYYQERLMKGYYLAEARRVITRGEVEGMLDQIRNRVLSFVLEIEKENPAAGEAEPGGDPPIAPERVQQSFVTHIYGGTNVLAPGVQNVIGDVTIVQGDWRTLQEALERVGVPADDVAALKQAIQEDEGIEEPPGPAVKGWLGDITARITTGSLTLGTSAAGSAIATLVLRHLGAL